MGTVVTFPDSRPVARDGIDPQTGSATVIILPVVRIERRTCSPLDDWKSTYTVGANAPVDHRQV